VRRYVPTQLLDGRPHLIVDGAPRPGTVCTLSHWPGTPTPDVLRADLSAEIALRALARPDLVAEVDAVSIDHYDEDGVVALALLVIDGLADAHGVALVEAARVGDFGVVTDRRHALVAFALAALVDAERTPVPGLRPGRRPEDWLEVCSAAATEALIRLPTLVAAPEDHEALWHDEAAAYDAALDAIVSGRVTVDEHAGADLAVVRLAGAADDPAVRAAGWAGRPVHPAAVHSATACTRVATLWGRRYELRYRYETWVRLETHRPRRRVDLTRLAAQLTAQERDSAPWVFDGAGGITPALHQVAGDSSLEPGQFLDAARRALAALDAGPPAWDPYGTGTRA